MRYKESLREKKVKGIILAGGKATRLYPATQAVSKQLIPVYDKPMIYYPLSILMLSGIRDILIISTPQDLEKFKKLLGDGSRIGVKFSYAEQDYPRGLPDAFRIGKDFIGEDNVCLVLGDNIFYGQGIEEILIEVTKKQRGATIFGHEVTDPQRYGVVEFDKNGKVLSIEEKPQNPKSRYAVIGLYFFDNRVIKMAENLQPSNRGETEITDLFKAYLETGELEVKTLGRGFSWFDTGTFDSMSEASEFVKLIQKRQGQPIACIEEIAYKKSFIGKEQLKEIVSSLGKSGYGEHLSRLLEES
ncbi:MAG: glucose-1-phosphate thymidylyltransferase RfbA [Nanoarchaeota archaeon]|nr:glucose-1-phosphate thymidylyltransferase RfbA [Nanoarchaeota archaeon]